MTVFALPPNFAPAAREDLIRSEGRIFGWVPFGGYARIFCGEIVEAREHLGIGAVRAAAASLGAAGDGGLILVAFVADPPDFFVAGGGDLLWGEAAVFGWVPFFGDGRILAGEVVDAGDDLLAGADWATAAVDTGRNNCAPFMAFITNPPDFAPGAGDDVARREVAIFGWVPLTSEIWIGCGEVVHAGQRQSSTAIWAACATAGAGVDGGLPVVTVGTGPPDFAFAAVADAVGGEWRVARAVPLGEKILALVVMAIF